MIDFTRTPTELEAQLQAKLASTEERLQKWIGWHGHDMDRMMKIQEKDREAKAVLLTNWENALADAEELRLELAKMQEDKAGWQQSSESWYQSYKAESKLLGETLTQRDDLQARLDTVVQECQAESDRAEAIAAERDHLQEAVSFQSDQRRLATVQWGKELHRANELAAKLQEVTQERDQARAEAHNYGWQLEQVKLVRDRHIADYNRLLEATRSQVGEVARLKTELIAAHSDRITASTKAAKLAGQLEDAERVIIAAVNRSTLITNDTREYLDRHSK